MDREAREHYTVVIQAKDMAGQVGGLSGSTTINITLTDINDNPPKFPQSMCTALAADADDENADYSANLLGANTKVEMEVNLRSRRNTDQKLVLLPKFTLCVGH